MKITKNNDGTTTLVLTRDELLKFLTACQELSEGVGPWDSGWFGKMASVIEGYLFSHLPSKKKSR